MIIAIGLVTIAIGAYWLPQSEWALLILAGLWGGVVLLALGLRHRTPSPTSVTKTQSEITQPAVTPTQPTALETDLRHLQYGFYLFLISFAIGWRQLWITSQLQIHPSEVIIWGLFVWRLTQKKPLSGSIPGSVKALLALGFVGLFTALLSGTAWDLALAEFKLFLIIIPILYVTHEAVCNAEQWRKTLLLVALTVFYISVLGLVEYFTPNFIPWFMRSGAYFSEQHVVYTHHGFGRASFTFWGTPLVSVYLSIMLVLLLSSAVTEPVFSRRLFLIVTIILCALALYIAGGRGPWVGAIGGVALYVFLSPKLGWLKLLMFLLVTYNAMLYFLPPLALTNLYSAFDTEKYYDTSRDDRKNRAEAGVELIKQSPLIGHGWGGSGWVHSDFIQIGANLGLPALLLFLYWCLSRIWRLYATSSTLTSSAQKHCRGVIAGLGVSLFHLGTQALIVLPFLIIPLWFLLAVADQFPALTTNRT